MCLITVANNQLWLKGGLIPLHKYSYKNEYLYNLRNQLNQTSFAIPSKFMITCGDSLLGSYRVGMFLTKVLIQLLLRIVGLGAETALELAADFMNRTAKH